MLDTLKLAMITSTLDRDREVNRVTLILGLFVSLIVAALMVKWQSNVLSDPDIWWHIKLGSDIWQSRTLPVVDTYSFTFAGEPFIAKEWLSQILWSFAYRAGEWNGVLLLAAASVSLAAFLTYREFARHLRPLTAASAMLVCFFLTSPIFLARPHNLSLPIVVIWTARLFHAADENTAPPWWLLGLMVLWANLHAGFTVGFMIAGFAAIHLLQEVGLKDRQLLRRWGIFLVLCPTVSLIHPYLYQPLLINFSMATANEGISFLSEWQPLSPDENRIHELALIGTVFALLLARLRLTVGKAGLLAFCLHMMLKHVRFFYAFFLITPLALAGVVARRFPRQSFEHWRVEPRDGIERLLAVHATKIVAGFISIAVLGTALVLSSVTIAPRDQKNVEEAIQFAQDNQLTGNVYNWYNYGGPLIFHGIKTFVDGRSDQIYQKGFLPSLFGSMKPGGETTLRDHLEKYHIQWTMLALDDPRVIMLDRMKEWERAYQNKLVVIHTRTAMP